MSRQFNMRYATQLLILHDIVKAISVLSIRIPSLVNTLLLSLITISYGTVAHSNSFLLGVVSVNPYKILGNHRNGS